MTVGNKDKWLAFDDARRTGVCTVCGWREGDGVRQCFYDADIGQATHTNKHPTGLSPEQATLYAAYVHPENGKLYFPSPAAREEAWAEYLARAEKRFIDNVAAAEKFGWRSPSRQDEDAARAKYRQDLDQSPMDTFPATWRREPGPRFTRQNHVSPPHAGCPGRGHPRGLGPYHIGCTGCDVEVRLWEHGIDYDVG